MGASLRCLLTVLAILTAAPASADWHEARSKHFIIYSEGPIRDLREYATKLEKFDKAVRVARKMTDPPLGAGGKLTVYVLEDAKAVAAMAGSANVAGFYLPRASGSIAFAHRDRQRLPDWIKDINRDRPASKRFLPVDPETVFFHEYFHHMMLSDAGAALPKWIVEGFAEYFSTAAFERDGSVILGRPATHRASALFSGDKISLEELLAGTTRKLSSAEFDQFYGRGWLLTHYLSTRSNRAGQLQRYIEAIQQGQSSLEAARLAFGDLKVLNAELQQYLKSSDMGGYRVPSSALQVEQVAVRTLSAGASEMMPVRMQSDKGVDEKTAAAVAARAREVAAKYPNDLFVQGALAEAEHDAGNLGAALAAADRALAIDPDNLQALIYKGRVLMRQAKGEKKKETWDEVRRWFARANKADPEYAEPLMLYYQSFGEAGVAAPASAVDGLTYAVLLAPRDQGLRMSAVRELLNRNNLEEASATFAPIAHDPHATPEWRERNVQILAAMQAKKRDEAVKLMNAPPPKTTAADES
jgi:cytochrome c-type biogenesis protein CcmH/NrfG